MTVHRGREAVALLSGQSLVGEATVVCPSCRHDNTHVHHVGTLIGSDQHEAVAAHEGTDPTGATPQRRSAVEIVFSCEHCPEQFALVIQQCKGNNLVEVHQGVRVRAE